MNLNWDTTQVTGLFGGSFDPVHNGHLGIARLLVERGLVDQLILIPAAQAPHKLARRNTPSEHRLAMLQVAVAGEKRMFVSDFEIRRAGVSYTIDTVRHFHALFGANLRVVIGLDSLLDLNKWRESRELVGLCPFLTWCRPGAKRPDFRQLERDFGPSATAMLQAGIVEAELFDISSTAIRERLASGKSAASLLPPAVLAYITAHQLYKTQTET